MSLTTFDTVKFAQRLERDLMLLKWMIGFNLAFTMAVVWKVFS